MKKKTIYLYPWNNDDHSLVIRALGEDGEMVLESHKVHAEASLDPSEIRGVVDAMHENIRGSRPDTRVVYAADPYAHPHVARLLAEIEAEDAAIENLQPVKPPENPCNTCSKAIVCAARIFTSSIGAEISHCPEFQHDRSRDKETKTPSA